MTKLNVFILFISWTTYANYTTNGCFDENKTRISNAIRKSSQLYHLKLSIGHCKLKESQAQLSPDYILVINR